MNYMYKRAIKFRNHINSSQNKLNKKAEDIIHELRKGKCTPLNIVIIDDDTADSDLTKELLASENILNTPTVFEDSEKAINYLLKCRGILKEDLPDLILLDYRMPGKNGLEVLKELREHHDTLDIPIIMLTSEDRDDLIIESNQLKANGFLKKPINVQRFLEMVKEVTNSGFVIAKT